MTPESYIFLYQSIVLNFGYSLKSSRNLSKKKKKNQSPGPPPRDSDSVILGRGPGPSSPEDSDRESLLALHRHLPHLPPTHRRGKCSRTDACCTSRVSVGKARCRDPGVGVSWFLARETWINRADFLASRSLPPIHLPILQLRTEGEGERDQAAA